MLNSTLLNSTLVVTSIPVKISSVTDWSLIIALLGAISYGFGKIMSEASPLKDTSFVNRFQGLLFMAFFIFLPYVIVYSIFQKKIFIVGANTAFIIFLAVAMLIQIRFNLYMMSKEDKKAKLFEYLRASINKQNFFKRTIYFIIYKRIHPYLLVIITTFQFWLFYCIFLGATSVLTLLLALLLLLIYLIMVAILYWNYGVQNYFIEVLLTNGTVLNGKLIKIEEDVVSIKSKDKFYHIRNSEIVYTCSVIEKNKN